MRAIREPNDPAGLWADVKPHTQWPQTDETIMIQLAGAWDAVGGAFDKAGREPPDNRLSAGWDDDNGKRFQAKVAKLRELVADDAVRMKHLGRLARMYGEDVAHAKSEIRDVIYAAAPAYSRMSILFGLIANDEGRRQMVEEIARGINDFLTLMADRIAARGRGEPESPRPELEIEISDQGADSSAVVPPGGPQGPQRIEVPRLEGGTLQQVGGKIWGNGDPSHLIGTRSAEELRALASKADAIKLRDFYQAAANAGKGGKTAPARVRLAQEIIDAWG